MTDTPEIDDVEANILHDMESKYADMLCPVHGVPPKFEIDAKGGVVEAFCCHALLQMFRELSAEEDK